jgi:hypothetical protein
MRNQSRAAAPRGTVPAPRTRLQWILLLLHELVSDANRLADLADRFFVVLFDAGVDDKCRFGELPCACIEDPSSEHDADAGLLSLSRAGEHERTAFRLCQVVVLDVLKILFEPYGIRLTMKLFSDLERAKRPIRRIADVGSAV